jgi:hypothetical protein
VGCHHHAPGISQDAGTAGGATFASLHILNGAKLSWLQEQLGHSDVRLTRNTYGRWFKLRDLAAADHQDARSRLVVTEMVTEAENAG